MNTDIIKLPIEINASIFKYSSNLHLMQTCKSFNNIIKKNLYDSQIEILKSYTSIVPFDKFPINIIQKISTSFPVLFKDSVWTNYETYCREHPIHSIPDIFDEFTKIKIIRMHEIYKSKNLYTPILIVKLYELFKSDTSIILQFIDYLPTNSIISQLLEYCAYMNNSELFTYIYNLSYPLIIERFTIFCFISNDNLDMIKRTSGNSISFFGDEYIIEISVIVRSNLTFDYFLNQIKNIEPGLAYRIIHCAIKYDNYYAFIQLLNNKTIQPKLRQLKNRKKFLLYSSCKYFPKYLQEYEKIMK